MQTQQATPRDWRNFGLSIAGGLLFVGYVVLPLVFDRPLQLWPLLGAAPFAAFALLAPRALAPLYPWWMRFAHTLGRINTAIILSLVFYLLVTPIGLLRRAAVALRGGAAAERDSYRRDSNRRERQHLEKPY